MLLVCSFQRLMFRLELTFLLALCRYPNTVSAMAFSRDGSMLAVASSYTYERGDVEHGADEIYIRKMQDPEVKPKQRQPQK